MSVEEYRSIRGAGLTWIGPPLLFLALAAAAAAAMACAPAAGAVRQVTTPRTTVDSDGYIRSQARRKRIPNTDGWKQWITSLRTEDGLSLDPTTVRYVVVPKSERRLVGTVAVALDPSTMASFAAVVGDVGPAFGEVSLKLAHDLDRSTGPRNGIDRPLVYTFFPNLTAPRKTQGELLRWLSDHEFELRIRAFRSVDTSCFARLRKSKSLTAPSCDERFEEAPKP